MASCSKKIKPNSISEIKDDNPVSLWREKNGQESHGSEKGVAFGFEFCLMFHWIGRQGGKDSLGKYPPGQETE
jgi:hypothetical protein